MRDKEAKKEYDKARYEANKEAKKEAKKEANKEYRETHKIQNKEYRETHRIQQKEYRETHKEAINAHAKAHYEANKEAINKRSKAYREANCKCRSCGIFITTSKTDYLCSYCNPGSSKRQRTKEIKIKEFLESNSINFINNKQFENGCCLKYRPDFVIDCVTYYLIIEVDENAHSSYDKECEIIRMNNISSGIGLPVKFIRYNPDKKGIKSIIKQKELLEVVQANMNKEFMEDLSVVYLFY